MPYTKLFESRPDHRGHTVDVDVLAAEHERDEWRKRAIAAESRAVEARRRAEAAEREATEAAAAAMAEDGGFWIGEIKRDGKRRRYIEHYGNEEGFESNEAAEAALVAGLRALVQHAAPKGGTPEPEAAARQAALVRVAQEAERFEAHVRGCAEMLGECDSDACPLCSTEWQDLETAIEDAAKIGAIPQDAAEPPAAPTPPLTDEQRAHSYRAAWGDLGAPSEPTAAPLPEPGNPPSVRAWIRLVNVADALGIGGAHALDAPRLVDAIHDAVFARLIPQDSDTTAAAAPLGAGPDTNGDDDAHRHGNPHAANPVPEMRAVGERDAEQPPAGAPGIEEGSEVRRQREHGAGTHSERRVKGPGSEPPQGYMVIADREHWFGVVEGEGEAFHDEREQAVAACWAHRDAVLASAAPSAPQEPDADLEAWRTWAFAHVGARRRCSDLRDALDARLAQPTSAPHGGPAEGETAIGWVRSGAPWPRVITARDAKRLHVQAWRSGVRWAVENPDDAADYGPETVPLGDPRCWCSSTYVCDWCRRGRPADPHGGPDQSEIENLREQLAWYKDRANGLAAVAKSEADARVRAEDVAAAPRGGTAGPPDGWDRCAFSPMALARTLDGIGIEFVSLLGGTLKCNLNGSGAARPVPAEAARWLLDQERQQARASLDALLDHVEAEIAAEGTPPVAPAEPPAPWVLVDSDSARDDSPLLVRPWNGSTMYAGLSYKGWLTCFVDGGALDATGIPPEAAAWLLAQSGGRDPRPPVDEPDPTPPGDQGGEGVKS